MVDRDPLDELRAAWVAVTPPSPDSDPQTDALVEDLRAIWDKLEVPDVSPHAVRPRLQMRARATRLRDRAVLTAAASLLIALVFSALQRSDVRRAPGEQLATHETTPDVQPDARLRRLSPSVQATIEDDGSLELRHGRVRLVLGGTQTITTTTRNEVALPAADEE